MGFMDILNQYASQAQGEPAPAVAQHFDQVAQQAPTAVVSQGLAEAFRADQTPPFGEMVAHLFGKSDPQQRAGLLNELFGALGPALLSSGAGGQLGDVL